MKKNKVLNKFLYLLTLPILILGCTEELGEAGGTSSNNDFQFASIASSFAEEDGDATILVPFRNAGGSVSADDLEIGGTATAGEDYDVVSVTQEGVEISLMDDAAAEVIETIRFTIPGGAGNAIHEVKLFSDDPGFMNVTLAWADAVDLDLISWYYDSALEAFEFIDFSDPGNTLDPIDWTDEDGVYGFTYNYYAGADNSVPFTVTFAPTGVKLEGATDPLVFNATYTLANVDPNNVQIEQLVTKEGTEFFDFTDIEVPTTGSRTSKLLLKLREAVAKYNLEKGN